MGVTKKQLLFQAVSITLEGLLMPGKGFVVKVSAPIGAKVTVLLFCPEHHRVTYGPITVSSEEAEVSLILPFPKAKTTTMKLTLTVKHSGLTIEKEFEFDMLHGLK